MTRFPRNEIRMLLSDVSSRTGLDFGDRKVDQLRESVERAISAAGCGSVSEFRRRLQSDSGAFDDFVGALTVGETFFFREPAQFEVIRERILPELSTRRGIHQAPRVWSAGCSSGEEAYTLAILLEEADPGGPARVLATDISRPALQRAREARYRNWSLRGDRTSRLGRYLSRENDLHVLDPRIRKRVTFEYLNLATDVYPSLSTNTWGIDLILCRNVLIYFDRQTVSRVFEKLQQALVPGGWLILGASDPHAADFAPFETVQTAAGVMFRRPQVEAENFGERSGRPTWLQADAEESDFESPAEWSPDENVPVPGTADEGWLAAARAHLLSGDSRRVAELTRDHVDVEEACVLHVRALTNYAVDEAEEACARFAVRHRLSEQLHYLHAVLLLDQGRYDESLEQLRRLTFLNRSLAIAHLLKGTIHRRLNQTDVARRCFHNCIRLCADRDPGDLVPLGEGETVEQLRQTARRQLDLLDSDTAPSG